MRSLSPLRRHRAAGAAAGVARWGTSTDVDRCVARRRIEERGVHCGLQRDEMASGAQDRRADRRSEGGWQVKLYCKGDAPPDGGDLFVKKTQTRMWKQSEPFSCQSREGTLVGQPGDWLAQDGHGGFYPISDEVHPAEYVGAKEAGKGRSKTSPRPSSRGPGTQTRKGARAGLLPVNRCDGGRREA